MISYGSFHFLVVWHNATFNSFLVDIHRSIFHSLNLRNQMTQKTYRTFYLYCLLAGIPKPKENIRPNHSTFSAVSGAPADGRGPSGTEVHAAIVLSIRPAPPKFRVWSHGFSPKTNIGADLCGKVMEAWLQGCIAMDGLDLRSWLS